MGSNEDLTISYKEFCEILRKPEGLQALEDVDVSPLGIVDFAELFFFENGEGIKLSFEAFMECVLDLRGSNTATVKDVLELWKKIRNTATKEAVLVKNNIDRISDKV